MAWMLTQILFLSSLIQALLTVLSQVLCFIDTEWYLPLLVIALVLGWLDLLYYTRGFQHTGIYSVMIQKVRDGSGPGTARLGRAGNISLSTPSGLMKMELSSTPNLSRREPELFARVSFTQIPTQHYCRHGPVWTWMLQKHTNTLVGK